MSNESNEITVVFIIRICFKQTLGLALAPLYQLYPLTTTMANLLPSLLQQRMELAMKASMAQPLDNCNLNDKSMQDAIKSKMAVYERSAVHGRSLQLVYSHLLSLPPSSVEAERAFSLAGLLCTRI